MISQQKNQTQHNQSEDEAVEHSVISRFFFISLLYLTGKKKHNLFEWDVQYIILINQSIKSVMNNIICICF